MSEPHGGGLAANGDGARLEHTTRIRDLNDLARASLCFRHIYVTLGIRTLGVEAAAEALTRVRTFDAFGPDNDPYGEHDFGSFTLAGQLMFFKVDYCDRQLAEGSPNPADERVTSRVLTVMLATEY